MVKNRSRLRFSFTELIFKSALVVLLVLVLVANASASTAPSGTCVSARATAAMHCVCSLACIVWGGQRPRDVSDAFLPALYNERTIV